jgi:hypothetical protein
MFRLPPADELAGIDIIPRCGSCRTRTGCLTLMLGQDVLINGARNDGALIIMKKVLLEEATKVIQITGSVLGYKEQLQLVNSA